MTRPARKKPKWNSFLLVFICGYLLLIIKISIIWLTPNARQLLGALFVRRLRFRLVKHRKMDSFLFRGFSVFFRG